MVLKLKGGTPVPAIGTTTSGAVITIPEELDLIIFTNNQGPNFTVTDRVAGNWSGTPLPVTWIGFPYWNGSALETGAVEAFPRYVRFDGRIFATVSVNASGLQFCYLPHDAQAPTG